MNSIKKDRVVAFRYVMKNNKGEVLEDTTNEAATVYLHGASDMQQLLQDQFEGLQAGDTKKIYLPGSIDLAGADFSFVVTIDDVRMATSEELKNAHPVISNAGECGSDCSCYTDKNISRNDSAC